MKKIGLILLIILVHLSVFADEYFEFKNTKAGTLQIFRNGQEIDLSKINDIEESAIGKEVYLDTDKIPEIQVDFKILGGQNGKLSIFLKYNPNSNKVEEISSNIDLYNIKLVNHYIISSYKDVGFLYEAVSIYNNAKNKINLVYKDQDGYTDLGLLRHKGGFVQIVDKNKNILDRQAVLLSFVSKSNLYKSPVESSQTKMYLIVGDKVTLLDEQTDNAGQKWYYISYQGKKEIKAWTKAEAVK